MTTPAQSSIVCPNYGYHVYGWMTGLGLSILELNLYAIIYSFSAKGGKIGKIAFFEAWTGAKNTAVKAALKTLKKRELIVATKGTNNCTLYFAPSFTEGATVDRGGFPPADRSENDPEIVGKRPTDRSENDPEMVGKRPTSRSENDPEMVGKRPTLTRYNQINNYSVEELVNNIPANKQMLAIITALDLGFSKPEMDKCADKWLDTCKANGWVSRTGLPIYDWQAHLRNYARAWAANNAKPTARTDSNRKSSTSSYNDKIASEYR